MGIYIDGLVDKVNACNVGCYVSCINASIFLYADDIILLAPTITALELLLRACESELKYLDMQINVSKSLCIRFGSAFDIECKNLSTKHGDSIQWAKVCRYLGVYLISGRTLKCSFNQAKCKFFRAFNSIFGKVGRFASEEVILSLLRSKCVPCLLYSIEACPCIREIGILLSLLLQELL
jgi:hypothetical protein